MRRLFAVVLAAVLCAPLTATGSVLPQNDAGTGRDAPDVANSTFRINPGVVYDGMIEGILLDDEDWYAFDAPAGARIEVAASGVLGCVSLHDSSGTELDFACPTGYLVARAVAVAPASGTYYASYSYLQPDAYRFSVGVGTLAPAPGDLDLDDLFGSNDPLPAVSPASTSGKHSVVAVVDTGINPYHQFFRAPALATHPRTWLPGFPKTAKTVNLSLGASGYDAARAADAAKFAGLTRTTYDAASDTFDTHLYTFPGTRVVGAVSFGEYVDNTETAAVDRKPVLDDNGHGTHSAGLAAGANLAAADGDVLVVMVEVGKGDFEKGVRWAARQPWIDAISVSLGLVANAPVTTSALGSRTGMEWATREASRNGKPVFMASGNGVSNTGLAPDHCTTYTSPYTGPGWVTRVGAAEHRDGSPTWWHCVPVDAIARTDVQSPDGHDTKASSSASGTSAATPNVAGHYAHLLLAGRRARSTATRATVLDYLLHAAQPAAMTPGAHEPSVYPLSLADQGYGLVAGAALDAATTRLVSGRGPAARPETTQWFTADAALRASLWGSP